MITDHTDEAVVTYPSSYMAHSYLTSVISGRLLYVPEEMRDEQMPTLPDLLTIKI